VLISRDRNGAIADDVCQLMYQRCMMHYKKYLNTKFKIFLQFKIITEF